MRKAVCPRKLIVDRPLRPQIRQVNPVLPTAFQQPLVEQVGISKVPEPLGRTHIQPDAQVRASLPSVAQKGEDAPMIPPDRRAHDSKLAEDIRMLKPEIERDQPSQGGPAERCALRSRHRPVRAVDKRFEFVDQQASIRMALAAAGTEVARGRVLSHTPEPCVRNAHKDDGFDIPRPHHRIGRSMRAPGAPGNVREPPIEEVLAIVQVEDRKAARRIFVVSRRQMDCNGAFRRHGEDCGVKATRLETRFRLMARGLGHIVPVEARLRLGQAIGELVDGMIRFRFVRTQR